MSFFVLYKRDVVNIVMNPVLLLTNTISPILFILIFGYLSNGSYGESGITSYDYYGVTILIYGILNVSMTASNSFMEKRLKNSNLRVMYSPIRVSYLYLSKIFATFTFTSVCYLFVMCVAHVGLHVTFGGRNVGYVMIIMLLFNFLSAVIGVLFCCMFKSEEVTNKILSLLNNAFAILGGVFFSLDGLGDAVRTISYISPVKWVVECVMKIIYDQDFSLFLTTGGVLVLLTCFGLVGCKFLFKVEDYV
ncbi:ABC transporter permease [Bacillus sp. WLY-B-L8]|uniref:ABC transporter permease n=1 Tax=Bacillus multifaciens TaxID=3068506 RepID=UPI00274086A2|nr:ABC transporter permease [Bacillus sp. WLY-B-L8]MDP7978459.1 ABC transporter permease [Bacillus sp. WLY-B-L8]